ncbi:unnamed protein product [Cunninghamella blakesleeana]
MVEQISFFGKSKNNGDLKNESWLDFSPNGFFYISFFCFSLYFIMARHHPNLIFCRKQPGIAIGRLCEKCDGRCVICDSYVRPATLVRICDECNFGSFQGRCVVCGGAGVSDAYYCVSCTRLEKDREGCPKIINLGSSKTDLFYERKKFGFKKS